MSASGPPGEFEPGKVVEEELERLIRHPRAETERLKQVAADGESGPAPFIEMALVARWVVPIVAVVVGIALLVYFKA